MTLLTSTCEQLEQYPSQVRVGELEEQMNQVFALKAQREVQVEQCELAGTAAGGFNTYLQLKHLEADRRKQVRSTYHQLGKTAQDLHDGN